MTGNSAHSNRIPPRWKI